MNWQLNLIGKTWRKATVYEQTDATNSLNLRKLLIAKEVDGHQYAGVGKADRTLLLDGGVGGKIAPMSAAVFEMRWNRLLDLRASGHEELTDFLGRHSSLGPLVRLGLLRRRESGSEFQRYNGYVPTRKGLQFLIHAPEEELILVRPEKSASLFLELQNDPMPKALFKETFAEPTSPQLKDVMEQKANAGRDVWRVQRAEFLWNAVIEGFMDMRCFTKRHGAGDGSLLRLGLCKPRVNKPHERALEIQVTAEGAPYLEEVINFGLLLVKPGMELPLFELCEPARAEYWCRLP